MTRSAHKDLIERLKNSIKLYDGGTVPIEYLLTGPERAETILFVHSVEANIKLFFPNVPYFVSDYRILCLSLRGHGRSGRPRPESAATYTLARMADDLKGLVDYLGIDLFHYVGSSIGGLVGYELLSRHPRYFKTLTAVGIPAEFKIPTWLGAAWTRLLLFLAHLIGRERYSYLAARVTAKTPESFSYLAREITPQANLRASHYAHQGFLNCFYLDLLKRTQIPILIIQGQYDYRINLLMGSTLKTAQVRPNCRLVCLRGAGHMVNLDRPDEFNQAVEEFLANYKESEND